MDVTTNVLQLAQGKDKASRYIIQKIYIYILYVYSVGIKKVVSQLLIPGDMSIFATKKVMYWLPIANAQI